MKNASYFDPTIYSVENLSESDKKRVEAVQSVKEKLLTEDTVKEYCKETGNSGSHLHALLQEALTPFVKYLHEQAELYISDLIIDIIDGYSEADLQAFMERRNQEQEAYV